MSISTDKKSEQLGMPLGTAANKLRKSILFNLLKKHNENYCFQCGAEIESADELSIEHKIPYLDSENPKELFFNLDNIAFSHLNCNTAQSRRNTRYKHPTYNSYRKGCRCTACKAANAEHKKLWRFRKSQRTYGQVHRGGE